MKHIIFSILISLLCVSAFAQGRDIIISAEAYANSPGEVREILLAELAHQIQSSVSTSTTTTNDNGHKKYYTKTTVKSEIELPPAVLTRFEETAPGEYYAEINVTYYLLRVRHQHKDIDDEWKQYLKGHPNLPEEHNRVFRNLELGKLLRIRDLYDNPISMVFDGPTAKKMVEDYKKIIDSKIYEFNILYFDDPEPVYPIYQTVNGYQTQILIDY